MSFEGLIVGEATPNNEGTPITRELLLAEGFTCRVDELTPEELDKEVDPFYYYKGQFRLYDQLDEYYFRTSGSSEGNAGRRIMTMEQLKDLYQNETGNVYTKYPVLEDTAPTDLPDIRNLTLAKGMIKIKLKGGPGDGKTAVWPAVASFFVYQYKGEGGRTEGARYKRKVGTKKTFLYAGPTN